MAGSVIDQATQVGLPRIMDEAGLAGLRVEYPDAHYRFRGLEMNWLLVFLVGTLVGAVLPARLMKIQL
jgi:hypothetical protein